MLRPQIILSTLGALTLVLLAACSSKPEDKLVGTWVVDVEATLAGDPRLAQMPDDQREEAIKATNLFLGNMSFEFTRDGKAITSVSDSLQEGRYTVQKVEGDKITIEATVGDGEETRSQVMTAVVDGDTLHLEQVDQVYVLKRK